MTSTETKEPTPEPAESEEKGGAAASTRSVDRRGIAAGLAVFAACAGLVVYGVLNTDEEPAKPPVPTAAVTYEVTGKGSADLTYQARSEMGTGVVVHDAALPWKKTVRVPLGEAPTITVALDGKGGEARCQLAVRGKHVQTATAFGTYGRATCQGELAAPENTTEGTAQ
ncbi:hypothetical protein [Streptomyces longispororuber]|uniref:hypothetical protein n=1 Tax=Streptomyces longispororuber TaxID=68230 RepID=UPI00210B9537|nr:hypothetical protein [Streptomyces longispororuber]MCQ4209819.1 hypothetical protein [Streptomyces longispororuber]